MIDQEWIETVRCKAAYGGSYIFDAEERKAMARYVQGAYLNHLHQYRFATTMRLNHAMVEDFLNEVEKGIAATVTAQLIHGSTK